MISLTTIDQIRELPIEQVISNYLTLKKKGTNFTACCPLHDEKTPSFVVNPVKNIFKCFGCHQGGDSIQFVMLKTGLTFVEACKEIAANHGVIVEEDSSNSKTQEQIDQETAILDVLANAQEYYSKSFDPQLVKYLIEERKLTPDTIIEWNLGLCTGFKSFTEKVIASGKYRYAEMGGVVRTKNETTYDFFHHRIIIPIHDKRGRVIAFGGRILPGKEGQKYINSPDTIVYNKSCTLFGLHKAIKGFKEHGLAVLVEGYFDVIKLHERGWNNTVGTCGTALTEKHAKILRRYTDTVLILRDGDSAGRNAIEKDIPILIANQFQVYVAILPEGEDPDTLFDPFEKAFRTLYNYKDGIDYLCNQYLSNRFGASETAVGIEKVVSLLSLITSNIRVEQYIKSIAKKFGLKASELSKPLDKYLKKLEAERIASLNEQDDESELPLWVDKKRLEDDGFVQLRERNRGFKIGIYFPSGNGKGLIRVTNFTFKPLFHVYETSNNRRLVEVSNGERTVIVEITSDAMINQSVFERELVTKGHFITEFEFGKKYFKRLTGWLSEQMPIAYELKTLGWQPEGFFAFSNAVYYNGSVIQYDPMGMIKIEDRHFLSLGKSSLYKDDRATDNPYENDLYLELRNSPITFQQWAELFYKSYDTNAPYAIAFAFLTIFKDVVTKVAKMPMLYPYGTKGSGKSSMAESIAWLFFSGTDTNGDLIKAYNLNPGQGTPFSFFNRIERFRNCPILFNEFDENVIEDWKFGTFKAAYDGEGREVGDGETGKKRKTRIQKVQGTLILIGQYLSIKDDGSVLSRCIPCHFNLERIRNISDEQINAYKELQALEKRGLSSLVLELLKHRHDVELNLKKQFIEAYEHLTNTTRERGHRIETRLISNYSLILAATKMLGEIVTLPYSYALFYSEVVDQVIALNKLLKDNSAVHQFWKGVEYLFDKAIINPDFDLKITEHCTEIGIKSGGEIKKTKFGFAKSIIQVRFSNVYSAYAKFHRERTGKSALPEETLLLYMKDQPYYIGLAPYTYFSDKRTSAHVFDYDRMKELGIILQKNNHNDKQDDTLPTRPSNHVHEEDKKNDDSPF